MARIHIPAPLRTLTGGATHVDAPGETLAAALDALEARHPGVRARLVEGNGGAEKIRGGYALFVDGELPLTGLRTPLRPDSEVYFAPAIAGGG